MPHAPGIRIRYDLVRDTYARWMSLVSVSCLTVLGHGRLKVVDSFYPFFPVGKNVQKQECWADVVLLQALVYTQP